ncbi:hypothetical protein ACFPYJ_33035 [Paenibacillus solisilvae]|uniref:Intracellular proteinase inhibitor BsuPI domain-containing protein n=1 Tax=Paenibacillus solisilvae TaxID=2486751 RepID=A0ABW0W8S6_9BACL
MKMKSRFLVVILFVMVALTACANNKGNEGKLTLDDNTRGAKPDIYHKETIGSLAYEIQLAKNQYGFDDEIEVNAKVTNLGKETLTYVSGSSSCPSHLSIDIVDQESNTRLATEQGKACTSDLRTSKLDPGQTVEDKWVFIPKQWIKSELEPANAGIYDVKVALSPEINLSSENQQEHKNQRVAAKTEITLY